MTNTRDLTEIKARALVAAHLEDTHGDFSSAAVSALAADVLSLCALYEASQDALTDALAQLGDARALLMDCWHQLDGDVYVLPSGEVHPGAVTTLRALHAYLWPEGKTI